MGGGRGKEGLLKSEFDTFTLYKSKSSFMSTLLENIKILIVFYRVISAGRFVWNLLSCQLVSETSDFAKSEFTALLWFEIPYFAILRSYSITSDNKRPTIIMSPQFLPYLSVCPYFFAKG